MKHMREEPLIGAVSKFKKLDALDRLGDVGMEMPETLRAPFTFRWDPDRCEGRVMLRETLLARIKPWHRDHYNGPARPILLSRTGLPEDALIRIRAMTEEACAFAQIAHAAVTVLDAERKAADLANRTLPVPPAPPRLFARIISTRAQAVTTLSVDMPIGGTARALSGLEALNKTASLVLERGHKGKSFRFMVKDNLIADIRVSVEPKGLEQETAVISIKDRMRRRLDPDAVKTELEEGLTHWNRTFSESGLVAAVDAVSGLPSIDVLSVQERTGPRNPRLNHVETFGDLSVAGVGLGYTLSLRYKGLTFASVIMSEETGDMTGKMMPITPDVMGNATWIMGRDLMNEIEARWRCGAGRLDPENFPGIQNPEDFGI